MTKFYLSILVLTVFYGCRPSTVAVTTSAPYQLSFLDTLAAAERLTTDEAEGFFDKVRPLDIELQMKAPSMETDEVLREQYRLYLRGSVQGFTAAEQVMIKAAFEEVYQRCQKVAPNVFPAHICLIKTNMNHYGSSVYYSREHCIVIPENVLRRSLGEEFQHAILKEIFHIYLRQNYWQRLQLYERIGFEEVEDLGIPEPLNSRLLLPPSSINRCIIRNLGDANDPLFVGVPLVYTKRSPTHKALSFYSNLEFSIFKVENNQVITKPDGSTTVDMATIQNFYEQISRNTTFITHPNEILSENFVLLANWRSEKVTLKELFIDKEGQELLLEIEKVLKLEQ